MQIEKSELTRRAKNNVYRYAGLKPSDDLAKLAEFTRQEVRSWEGVGLHTIHEYKEVLRNHNLSFKK